MLHFLLQISVHAGQCDDVISECSAPLMTAIHAGQCDDITWLFCFECSAPLTMAVPAWFYHTKTSTHGQWPRLVFFFFFLGGGGGGGGNSPKHKFHIQSHKKNKTKTPLSLPEVFHTQSWVPWNQILFWPKRSERNKSAMQEVLLTTLDVIVHLTPRNICLIIQKHFVSFLVKQIVLAWIHRSTALTPNKLCGRLSQKCKAPNFAWTISTEVQGPTNFALKVSTEVQGPTNFVEGFHRRAELNPKYIEHSFISTCLCMCMQHKPTVSLPTGPPPSLLPLALL